MSKILGDGVYTCFSVSTMSEDHFGKELDKFQKCIMPKCGRKARIKLTCIVSKFRLPLNVGVRDQEAGARG